MTAKKSTKSSTTPLMEQYLAIKVNYEDVILLYRMGDFYETFYDDAKIISKVLGIALTKRAHGKAADVPLAGFPYHALDAYLPKLIQAGHKVAICEQVEDPKKTKTIVKREVIEIVTPGTTISEKLLDNKTHNFVAAVKISEQNAGLSYCDISTGEFFTAEVSINRMVDYLRQVQPKEILLAAADRDNVEKIFGRDIPALLTVLDEWIFSFNYANEILSRHFKTPNLKGFGVQELTEGVSAAGAILHYIKENYKNELEHLSKIVHLALDDYMILDATTRRNLEITSTIWGEQKEGTLLSILDETVTPMGGRLLKRWITHPLIKLNLIVLRQGRVSAFYQNSGLQENIRELLNGVSDMERLLSRISTGRANPRDIVSLRASLELIEPIRNLIKEYSENSLQLFAAELEGLSEIVDLISAAIVESPPLNLKDGGIIKESFNAELDELRYISRSGKEALVKIQEEEKTKTGISSLKIGYNKVFGYYFEVTRVHQDKVPDYFIRKQTLVNAERYITPELKEFEEKILGAEDKINEIEYSIFQDVRTKIAEYGIQIKKNAELIAELDCLSGFAEAALKNNFVRPELDESSGLEIHGGRHPVVEHLLPPEEGFIENDTHLNTSENQVMIITGPNMSGKSTYLRQVGLIALLAQLGSFVPAESAKMGIVDRIFTRVGASDNLWQGESTFLVEMLETANILNNATPKSLIILDEVGRGTSTYDGLSIAWAVTEYLHNFKNVAAKTLFATHYHELTELAGIYPRIKNYRVAVREIEDSVLFLRKIEPGGIDDSYGVHVAQMAGLPEEVIERAKEVLKNLESGNASPSRLPKIARRRAGMHVDKNQLNLLDIVPESKIEVALKEVNVDQLTPLQALIKLNELKGMMREDE